MSANGSRPPGADLMEYHRRLAMSQVLPETIYRPGYIDGLHAAEQHVSPLDFRPPERQAEVDPIWAADPFAPPCPGCSLVMATLPGGRHVCMNDECSRYEEVR